MFCKESSNPGRHRGVDLRHRDRRGPLATASETCGDISDFTGWAFDKASRLHYVKRTEATGKCLAVPGGSRTEGARLILWPCGTGFEQQWFIGNA